MTTIALRFGVRALFVGTALACSSDSSTRPRRQFASIEITVPEELEVNQPGTATTVVKDADGVQIDDGAVTWSSSFTPVAAIQPQTGETASGRSRASLHRHAKHPIRATNEVPIDELEL